MKHFSLICTNKDVGIIIWRIYIVNTVPEKNGVVQKALQWPTLRSQQARQRNNQNTNLKTIHCLNLRSFFGGGRFYLITTTPV